MALRHPLGQTRHQILPLPMCGGEGPQRFGGRSTGRQEEELELLKMSAKRTEEGFVGVVLVMNPQCLSLELDFLSFCLIFCECLNVTPRDTLGLVHILLCLLKS